MQSFKSGKQFSKAQLNELNRKLAETSSIMVQAEEMSLTELEKLQRGRARMELVNHRLGY